MSIQFVATIVRDLEECTVHLLHQFIVSLLRVLLDQKGSEIEAPFRVDVALAEVGFGCGWGAHTLLGKEHVTGVGADHGEDTGAVEGEFEWAVRPDNLELEHLVKLVRHLLREELNVKFLGLFRVKNPPGLLLVHRRQLLFRLFILFIRVGLVSGLIFLSLCLRIWIFVERSPDGVAGNCLTLVPDRNLLNDRVDDWWGEGFLVGVRPDGLGDDVGNLFTEEGKVVMDELINHLSVSIVDYLNGGFVEVSLAIFHFGLYLVSVSGYHFLFVFHRPDLLLLDNLSEVSSKVLSSLNPLILLLVGVILRHVRLSQLEELPASLSIHLLALPFFLSLFSRLLLSSLLHRVFLWIWLFRTLLRHDLLLGGTGSFGCFLGNQLVNNCSFEVFVINFGLEFGVVAARIPIVGAHLHVKSLVFRASLMRGSVKQLGVDLLVALALLLEMEEHHLHVLGGTRFTDEVDGVFLRGPVFGLEVVIDDTSVAVFFLKSLGEHLLEQVGR